MAETYSTKYQDPQTAATYDEVICRSGEDPVWAAERSLLRRMIQKHVPQPTLAKTIDFACGTGRILEALRPLVGPLTGVDISPAMLQRAATRVPGVQLVCADITSGAHELPAVVDLVTSFRFLLLAEPPLREACLRALVEKTGDDGVLILNSHGNPWSFRCLATLRDRLLRRPRRLESFSLSDMRLLADQCGLTIIDTTGCGFVPQTIHRLLPSSIIRAFERSLAGIPIFWRFGTNLMFVLRRKDSRRTASTL